MSILEDKTTAGSVTEAAVVDTTVICPRCKAKNLLSASDCVSCGTALPTFDALLTGKKKLTAAEVQALERPTGIIGTMISGVGAITTIISFFFASWVTMGPFNSLGQGKTGLDLTSMITKFAPDGSNIIIQGDYSVGWKLWFTPLWAVLILGLIVLGYVNKKVIANLRTISFFTALLGIGALWLMLYTVDEVVILDPVIHEQGWKLSSYAEIGLIMAIAGMVAIFAGRFYIVAEITNRRIALLKADKAAYAGREITQSEAIWIRFRKHKLAFFGLIVLSFVILSVIFSGWIAPYDPSQPDPRIASRFANAAQADFTPPTLDHWLGTDASERDIFSRELYAGRISLIVGFLTVFLSSIIGMAVGAIAGYAGGWKDNLMMRFTDIVLSFPSTPLLLVLAGMLQKYEIPIPETIKACLVIVGVLTLLGWMGIARLVRGQILSLRSLDYIEASRALGASSTRIILRHLLPNSFAPVIVTATLTIGGVILTEAVLSFLGVGIQPNVAPTWGNMVQDYTQVIELHPYYFLIPGIAIFIVVLSINFIGDGLRDALDPRQHV